MLRAEQDRLILWAPVALVCGAALGATRLAAVEPWLLVVIAGLAAAVGLALQLHGVCHDRPLPILLALVLLLVSGAATGAALVGFKARMVAAPVVAAEGIQARVTGTVHSLDRSQKGRWRIVVDVAAVEGLSAHATPRRVRLTLVTGQYGSPDRTSAPPLPGTQVRCDARLNPPPGPVVPGSWDFARAAWFRGIGAVGYTIGGCELDDGTSTPSWATELHRWQSQASRHLAAGGNGEVLEGGGLLAAIATGDRSWLTQQETDDLQVSGLAHIVSVSGLHVGLVYGLVFFVFWKGLALWGWLALRLDIRKIAAVLGLCCAGAYALFSGAEAPALRALLMVAIASGAVLLDRKAVTMRGLAVAALLVVLWEPHSAAEPGFQMSFLATAALVALWEAFPKPGGEGPVQWPMRVGFWLAAALGVSLAASLATAPVAASTFGRMSLYSVLANLIAGPLQEFVVAPAAVAAAALSPWGLGDWFWGIARWGLARVMDVASWVAGLPGAASTVPWTGPLAPLLLISGVLWLCLWRSRLRFAAAVPILAGLVAWITAPQPVGWIAPAGEAVLAQAESGARQLCQMPARDRATRSSHRFEADRLLDAARVPEAAADRLLARSGAAGPWGEPCAISQPAWSAVWLAEPGESQPVLLVTIEGGFHWFHGTDLPQGAMILKDGGQFRLLAPDMTPAPWHRQPGHTPPG